MPNRFRKTIGILLVAVSSAGLLLAAGNLITLPSIQSQLLNVVPNAELAIAEAVAQSRRKSYYGLAVCSSMLLLGLSVIVLQRRGDNSFDRKNEVPSKLRS